MILLAYDGSDDADGAIDQIARLIPGAEATVLTVWEPLGRFMRTGPVGGTDGDWADVKAIDAASETQAAVHAEHGARRAAEAGLASRPQHVRSEDGVAATILATALEIDADLIALGTRGLAGVRSFLLGSVSHAVVQHADRAVLVTPSAATADRRRQHVRDLT